MLNTLIPLDGSKLSEEVLPFAVSLAKKLEGRLILLHAIDTSQFSSQLRESQRHKIEQLIEEARKDAFVYLAGVRDRVAEYGIEASLEVAAGTPAEAIVSHAQALGAGLIAMNTHGRSGFARWTLGSTTDRVIKEATLPVLVYRSAGEGHAPGLRNVLLPPDGSEAAEGAIAFATFFARTLAAPLTLVRVIPPPILASGQESELIEWQDIIAREAEDYLERVARWLRADGMNLQVRLLRGDPSTKLIAWRKSYRKP